MGHLAILITFGGDMEAILQDEHSVEDYLEKDDSLLNSVPSLGGLHRRSLAPDSGAFFARSQLEICLPQPQ